MSAVDQSSPSDQTSQQTTGTVPLVGTMLGGRYTITCRLAEGTFGHTYLAKDAHLPQCPDCVVKHLKPQTSERSMQMARRMFETEARVLYDLGSHEQIPQLMAHFEQDGEFFLVQEFIDGHAIADEMSPQYPWSEQRVVPLIEEILDVLRFVHGKQVIHRDLKPGNLLRRRRDGRIVLIDFGAVKEVTTRFLTPSPGHTDYTIAIGTVGYIPKEQLGGRPRFSSDVYAVGMLAIQALTGVHPNAFEEDSETAELCWQEQLLNPIHPDLVTILNRMVRYDFRERYTNAEDALKAIQTLPDALRQPTPLAWQTHYPRVEPGTLPPTQSFGSSLNSSIDSSGSSSDELPVASASACPSEPESDIAETDEMPASSASKDSVSSPTRPSPTTTARPKSHTQKPQTSAQSSAWVLSQPAALRPRTRPYSSQSLRSQQSASGLAGIVNATQGWIGRSWKVLMLIGGLSLGLLVVRGMVLSSGERSPAVQTLAMLHEPLLPGADRMVRNIQPEPEPVPAPVQASQLLVEGDKARFEQRYEEALLFYERALLLNESLVEAQWGRCVTYEAQSQLEAAMEACHDAVAINPNHAISWWSLSVVAEQMGATTEATKARVRALDLNASVAEEVQARLTQDPTHSNSTGNSSTDSPASTNPTPNPPGSTNPTANAPAADQSTSSTPE